MKQSEHFCQYKKFIYKWSEQVYIKQFTYRSKAKWIKIIFNGESSKEKLTYLFWKITLVKLIELSYHQN